MAEPPAIPEKPLKFSDPKMECSICQNIFNQPILLPCLHTFCRLPCLERIVTNKNGRLSLTCPLCQKKVCLPENGVAALQTDLHAENMLKRHEVLKKSERTKHKCENCKKSAAVNYCQECKKFMCEKCVQMHQMWGDFSSHGLLTLSEIKEPMSANPSSIRCERHKDKEALIYCETCSEMNCGDCTVISHRGHECHPVDDVFSKYLDELTSGLEPAKEMMETVHQALEAYNTRATEIDQQKANVEDDIHREIDWLHQVLDQRREDLLIALASSTQQKMNELATREHRVERMHQTISGCLDYAARCLQSGEKDEVVKLKVPILKRIEEITKELDPDTLQPKIEADIQCITDDRAGQACQEFGSIVTVSTVEENVYDNLDDTNFTLIDNQSYGPASVKSENPGQTQIISPHRSRATTAPVKIFEKPIRTIKGFNAPFGVTTNSKNQIIVVDSGKHRVIIMTSTGERISSFGKQGSGKGHFKRPCGVAVDNDDCIYVTDNNNHRIQKFTSDGRFLAVLGKRGNGRHQFIYPISICFNKTNYHLYVCDQLNHRIQVFRTDLTFVLSIGGRGRGKGKLNYPKSCAFDSSNNLYVADCSNNCV